MNVRPKRHPTYGFDPDQPKISFEGKLKMIYGDFLVIECEVYSPPSAEGRTVYVFLDDDDVTMLLQECRDAARRHRTKPDHQPTRWADLLPPKKSGFEDLADFLREHADD